MADFFGSPGLSFSENGTMRSGFEKDNDKSRRRSDFSVISAASPGPKSSTPFQQGMTMPFSPTSPLSPNKKTSTASQNARAINNQNSQQQGTPGVPEYLIWFQNLINARLQKTALCSGITFFIVCSLALLLLQCSIWSPISSVTGVINSLVSLRFYGIVIFASMLYILTSFLLCYFLANVKQTKMASLTNKDTHLAVLSQGIMLLIVSALMLNYFDWSLVFDKRIFLAQFALGTILCTISNVFCHDYQLLFGSAKLKSNFRLNLATFSDPNFTMLVQPSVIRAAQVWGISTLLAVAFGLISFDLKSVLAIFNLSAHYALLTIFVVHIFMGHAIHRLCKLIVMEPVSFPFPPPYTISNPTADEDRNLCNMLNATDPLLQLFALHDLRTVGSSDTIRRSEVFTLSQPAGNPRNWNVVTAVIFAIFVKVCGTVDVARGAFNGNDNVNLDDSGEESSLNREMLMMPPSARGQFFSAATRNRHRAALKHSRPVEKKPIDTMQSLKMAMMAKEETGLISRYEAEVAIMAIEALTGLVVASFTEDRFGVVQRDLALLIRNLMAVHNTIDKYIRYKGAASTKDTTDDTLTTAVQNASIAGLTRIGAKFQHYFREIGLTNTEITNFDSIVHTLFR